MTSPPIEPGSGGLPVALVGCGRWGAHVLRDLQLAGASVHVVAREAGSVARAHEGGAASVVGAIEALPEVAGAVVATPTSTHAAVTEAVLEGVAGPVFVEKPLCPDLDDALRLLALGGDRLFVMDKWRYHPGILELARMCREEELGRVGSLHLRRVTDRDPHPDVDTVWTHAPHDLAIALEILGEIPPVRDAIEERLAGQRVGLTATLGGPPWVTLEVSCVAPGHRRELRMVAEEGVAILDGGWSESLLIVRPGDDPDAREQRPVSGELPLLAELRAFVEHLQGGPAPKSSAAEAAEVVRRIEELGAHAREAGAPVTA